MPRRTAPTTARHGHGRRERTDIRGASMEKCWRARRHQADRANGQSYGNTGGAVRPVVSGSSNIRFMFWMA
jgi:hypothetical protein